MYAPPDLLLYMRDDTLLAQHWDWRALKPLGEPVSVADEIRFNVGNGRNAFSTSSTGVLAYRRGEYSEVVYTWHARDGKSDGPGWANTAHYQHIELSPDNTRAVVERQASTGTSDTDLDIVELAGGVVTRLTSDPSWRGDGKELVFSTPSGTAFMAAEVKPGTTFEVGLPKQIFQATRHARIIAGHDYAMTNDGKRFLVRETPNVGQENRTVVPHPKLALAARQVRQVNNETQTEFGISTERCPQA